MTKKKKISSHNQPTLFDWVREIERLQNGVPRGSLDIRTQFKESLADDLRHACDESGKELSRADVAARMSNLLAEEITETTINNWTAQSHPHRLPADYIPAWVSATGQRAAAAIISRYSGLFMLPGPEALRAEIQKLEEEEKRIRQEKQKRRFYLRELEGK